jgi:hypothetical protein
MNKYMIRSKYFILSCFTTSQCPRKCSPSPRARHNRANAFVVSVFRTCLLHFLMPSTLFSPPHPASTRSAFSAPPTELLATATFSACLNAGARDRATSDTTTTAVTHLPPDLGLMIVTLFRHMPMIGKLHLDQCGLSTLILPRWRRHRLLDIIMRLVDTRLDL